MLCSSIVHKQPWAISFPRFDRIIIVPGPECSPDGYLIPSLVRETHLSGVILVR